MNKGDRYEGIEFCRIAFQLFAHVMEMRRMSVYLATYEQGRS